MNATNAQVSFRHLEDWLSVATEGLCEAAASDIRERTYAACDRKIQDAMKMGATLEEARNVAYFSLGNARTVRRRSATMHLTMEELARLKKNEPDAPGSLPPIAFLWLAILFLSPFTNSTSLGIWFSAFAGAASLSREIRKHAATENKVPVADFYLCSLGWLSAIVMSTIGALAWLSADSQEPELASIEIIIALCIVPIFVRSMRLPLKLLRNSDQLIATTDLRDAAHILSKSLGKNV